MAMMVTFSHGFAQPVKEGDQRQLNVGYGWLMKHVKSRVRRLASALSLVGGWRGGPDLDIPGLPPWPGDPFSLSSWVVERGMMVLEVVSLFLFFLCPPD